jgi:hypothetical protein
MPDTETLRSRLARKPIVVAPGVYEGILKWRRCSIS